MHVFLLAVAVARWFILGLPKTQRCLLRNKKIEELCVTKQTGYLCWIECAVLGRNIGSRVSDPTVKDRN